jgi:predicted nucleic-acid-binding protein
VIDADAIVSQAFYDDSNHDLSVATIQKLSEMKIEVIYPTTSILEAVTVLQAKLNNKSLAYEVVCALIKPNKRLIAIDQSILITAMEYFDPVASKKHTLFDCVVAAVAKVNKANIIFSFDKFYKTKGFKLASDLL